jgi:hypothetical protein
MSEKEGASTSRNPKGLHGLYKDNFSFILPFIMLSPRPFETFRNKLIFYGEELLDPRPTPKLEKNHPLSAVREIVFNIFAATFHNSRASPPSTT